MSNLGERTGALLSIVRDPSRSAYARARAACDLFVVGDLTEVLGAIKPYLGDLLEGMREVAQSASDPEVRREAKEHAAWLEFRQQILRRP